MRDPQHDLAGHPRSPLSFEGLPTALQREHLTDNGPQLTSVDSPGQLRQRRPVGLDDKEDPACSRTSGLLGRLYDGDQHTPWFEERPGALPDLPAHQVEDHVYLARHLLEAPAFSVYKLLSPEPACDIFRPRSPRRYHVGARPPGQRYGGSPLMVQRARLRGEVARFDGDVARGRAVAVPVGQSVYLISYRKTGGAVAQSGYDARDLVGRDGRSTRLARAVNPCGRPLKLRGGKTRGAHFEQYVPDSGRG